LVVALSYCVLRDIERQPFIPPLGLRYANCEFPDLTSYRSGLPGYLTPSVCSFYDAFHSDILLFTGSSMTSDVAYSTFIAKKANLFQFCSPK